MNIRIKNKLITILNITYSNCQLEIVNPPNGGESENWKYETLNSFIPRSFFWFLLLRVLHQLD